LQASFLKNYGTLLAQLFIQPGRAKARRLIQRPWAA
jgi:hypothetical protein